MEIFLTLMVKNLGFDSLQTKKKILVTYLGLREANKSGKTEIHDSKIF